MKIDDMILVSIDDHVIEPADLFEKHMPARYRDQAPKFERQADGIDNWVFQGEVMGTVGLGAVASWPREEWGFEAVGHADMRPGCYDFHERVRDMNANGVLASINFPTAAGFAGAWLAGMADRALSAAAVSAYNDWQIDELAGSYPGRFIPMGILPLWDTDACVLELERIAAKGCTTVSFPETPYANNLPGFYGDHWDAVLEAAERLQIVLSMHIGGAFNLLRRPEGAHMDQLIILSAQLSGVAATDLITSGSFKKFPELKVALSEGGIGWVPFLLDRMDRHMTNHSWTHLDIGAPLATDIWRKNFLGCFITEPSNLRLVDRMGVDTVAWECDYPHSDSTWPKSPELLMVELENAGITDDVINKITWQNACRFYRFDPFQHTTREQATVGALRALATDVDTSTTSKAQYRERYAAHQA
ncbi:MAG: amidohydrolase family protein [Actinomycetota bacterium]|nr:amidohydrolase family protein [Actinomycetota bacterium]